LVLKLCLHGVRVTSPETFAEDVAKRLRLTVTQGKLREKEYGDNCSARYRRNKLQGGPLQSFRVCVLEGILLVNSRLSDLRDVEFTYRTGSEKLVLAAVRKLLSGSDQFVLVEPDLKQRLQAMAGKAYPEISGETGRLKAMKHTLDWQVLAISWFWHLLYNEPANKVLVRQLRVKIRRLRSCLVFYKEGLPELSVLRWQNFFREEAEALSAMRELDVAILACRRRRDAEGETPDSPVMLLDLFLQLRQEEQDKFFSVAGLNIHTEKLAEFLLWLYGIKNSPVKKTARETARHYAGRRIEDWSAKLVDLSRKYPDFSNVNNLHKIRIKVKRLRYVTQTIRLAALPPDLLRQLKQLQDVLGLLHDDYVNTCRAGEIAMQYPEDEKLQKEIHSFLSWQSARSESSLAVVPEMWENFLQMLEENQ